VSWKAYTVAGILSTTLPAEAQQRWYNPNIEGCHFIDQSGKIDCPGLGPSIDAPNKPEPIPQPHSEPHAQRHAHHHHHHHHHQHHEERKPNNPNKDLLERYNNWEKFEKALHDDRR